VWRQAGIGVACVVLGAGLPPSEPGIQAFFNAAGSDEAVARQGLEAIASTWHDEYAPILLDMLRVAPVSERTAGAIRPRILAFLERETGQKFGDDLDKWTQWTWTLSGPAHPDYLAVKRILSARIDPRMAEFFPHDVKALARWQEISWDGHRVDSPKPVDHPTSVSVEEVSFLEDSDVVFGVVVGGVPRAYPKQSLQFHQVVRDRFSGPEITVVYSPACGAIVGFQNGVSGRRFTLGISGLTYRSSTLLFDQETKSLWSMFDGRAVVGEMTSESVRLRRLPVATETTWGDWRRLNPTTTVAVLPIVRHSSEGAGGTAQSEEPRGRADVSVFALDMSAEPEILGIGASEATGSTASTVSITTDFLRKHPVYNFSVGDDLLVALTPPGGGTRVYPIVRPLETRQPFSLALRSVDGRAYRVTETKLQVVRPELGPQFLRRPAQVAFWSAWRLYFPNAQLLQ